MSLKSSLKIIVQVNPRLVTIQMTEEAQDMEVTEPQSEVAPEAAPEAARMAEPEPGDGKQSDQSVLDAGESSNVLVDARGRVKARRIPTKVFLANAMEEIKKLDFNKK